MITVKSKQVSLINVVNALGGTFSTISCMDVANILKYVQASDIDKQCELTCFWRLPNTGDHSLSTMILSSLQFQ